jgi:hypothetical protein
MAVSVIGGLLCSTVLSLVFVPAVFVLMDNVSRVTSRLSNRLISTKEESGKGEPEIKGAAEHPAGH